MERRKKGRIQEGRKERKEVEKQSLPSGETLIVTLFSSEWKSSKGGLSTINRELAIQLAKHLNVEVYVYVPKCSEEDKKVARSHSVQLIETEKLPSFEQIDWLTSLPKGHRPLCLIGHGLQLGEQIPLIKEHHDCKWIQVVHTAPEELGMYKRYEEAIFKGEQKHQAEVKLCELADQVVAVGPKLADAYSRYLRFCGKDEDVINLTPSIFTEFLSVKQATEERRTFCILVFGRVDGEDFKLKGYDIAVQAVAKLEDSSYHLMFVGALTGKEDEVAEKLLQHGIHPSQLTVRRFKESREELAKLFCEVDLAIMPSRTEGFGLTALEALSAGLPVLVSHNSGLGDALKKVPSGFSHVVDSEDPKDWAKAIKIVRQKGREVRLKEAKFLREQYALKYSWQEQCDCLVEKMLHLSFGNIRDKLERKEQSQVENANEKVDNLGKLKETSQEADQLQQMKSEIANMSEKLHTLTAQRKTEDEDIKEKLDTLMNRLPVKEKKLGMEDPDEIIDGIRELYKVREGWLAPFPWCEEFHFHLDSIFTRLKVVSRKKTRGTTTDNIVNMSGIFKPHEECPQPRTVLIEGKPGMGKTTYCKKLVYDWATGKQDAEDCFPRFQTVLLLKCRDMKSDLWEAIEDQLLPRDVEEDVSERFFNFICQNQSNVLLVLDGLDELSTSKLPVFTEIIQGRRELRKCRVVATARHEAGIKLRKHCDTLLQIEGFSEEDATKFIMKYFEDMTNLAEKLLSKLRRDKNLRDMAANPLNTALLCLICEEFKGVFPGSETQLYEEIIKCILRRYREKEGSPETTKDLVEVYGAQLKHLGQIALNGLLEGNLDFEEGELKSHADELRGFGFLSLQTGGSKLRPRQQYSFLHKRFQECFAGLYLCCQLLDREISVDELAADRRYRNELKEVLSFTCGLVAARCKKTTEALIKSITAQVNDEKCFLTLLEVISECKGDDSNFYLQMARVSGSFLKLQSLDLDWQLIIQSDIVLLAEAFKDNSSVTVLHLDHNGIHDQGATVLAEALKENSTLTVLHLGDNGIGDQGASGLAKALKVNSTLTVLHLGDNGIGDQGASGLAEVLKVNSTLTELHLGDNGIGDQGAAVLAEALKENSTLTVLHLDHNGIGDQGGSGLAEALKVNSTRLTVLHLSDNGIGDQGASGLAEALKVNSTLTELQLHRNVIGDQGATGLAEALKVNLTLAVLYLSGNRIGDQGATGLAKALKGNSSLTEFYLYGNSIGGQGATGLAEALKENSTLTELRLHYSGIGDLGATGLAGALKVNSTLAVLYLSGNGIGDQGATSLAEALKENSTLRGLHLHANSIGHQGATGLAEALIVNLSLSVLHLSSNSIGDHGTTGLAEALKENSTLTELDLSDNKIGDQGATGLAEALKENLTLSVLDLSDNKIGDQGATGLAEALKKNSSLIKLDLSNTSIGDQGSSGLAEALKRNSTLTELCLRNNAIGEQGATGLAEALETNSSLAALYLRYTDISQTVLSELRHDSRVIIVW